MYIIANEIVAQTVVELSFYKHKFQGELTLLESEGFCKQILKLFLRDFWMWLKRSQSHWTNNYWLR